MTKGDSLEDLSGVGPKTITLLKRIGLEQPIDLINNVPRAYDDYSRVLKIRQIRPGTVTIRAKFTSINQRYSKKGLHITEALANDETGSVKVMWFNQRFRASSLKKDKEYYVSGEFAKNYKYLVIVNPAIEMVSSFPLHTARLVPRYKLTKGLSSNQLRRFTKSAFEQATVKETLPTWLVESKGFLPRKDALMTMHFPESIELLKKAKRRVAFDELFEMTLASQLNKIDFAKEKAANIQFNKDLIVGFVDSLPFKLTDDQRRVIWESVQDMKSGAPMNRLLEGDVGSGKTVVAAALMLNAIADGYQAVLMAPTELLAIQHEKTLKQLLSNKYKNKVILLSGSMSKSQKLSINKKIESGEASIIVGTHALIQSTVKYNNLGLLIIDEQHRFGVEQRKSLQAKAKTMPHVLNMTATPIPRSLSLTLYGEMDVSIIAQKPKNRIDIETHVVQPEQRKKIYESIKKSIDDGRQAFVVCPLIDDNQLNSRPLDVKNIHKQLSSWFSNKKIALLHGKLKPAEKDTIMKDFVDKKYDLLVSTTVIEVGVDVPNATTMVIEAADKFGLAQLHQLRGRVVRGDQASKCILVLTENGNIPKRLNTIVNEKDGFKLAEYDLQLRGPGAIYGQMQHGALDLRVAKITDTKLISEAINSAKDFIKKGESLLDYPQLKTKVDELRAITNLN